MQSNKDTKELNRNVKALKKSIDSLVLMLTVREPDVEVFDCEPGMDISIEKTVGLN